MTSLTGPKMTAGFPNRALFDIPDSSFRPIVGGSFLWSGPVAGVELDVNATPDFLKKANTIRGSPYPTY